MKKDVDFSVTVSFCRKAGYIRLRSTEETYMKKVSTASLIIAIVLIVCAITLNILGFVWMNGYHVTRHYGNGFMQMTYTMNSASTSLSYTCLGMIIAGGFLFLGGILLLFISALTCHRPPKPCFCCKHHDEVEEEAPQGDCGCAHEAPEAQAEPEAAATSAAPEKDAAEETSA